MAGASRGTRDAMRHAGRRLGLAFQLRDDWLGVWGDPALTGKSAQTDVARRKLTYPIAFASASGRSELVSLYRDASSAAGSRIRALLEEVGAADATARTAAGHAAEAVAALTGIGLRASDLECFAGLAQFIAERRQ